MLALFACGGNSTAPESDELVFPDSGLSYINHIQPVFLRDCTSAGCHNAIDRTSGLDLETNFPTFQGDISLNPVVIPYDPTGSVLYRVLLGPDGQIPQQPPNRAPLSDEAIRAIRTWIEEGASTTN